MSEYRIFLIGDNGRVEAAEELTCSSDEEACEIARAISTDCSVIEVWSGTRQISTFEVGPERGAG